MLSFELLCLKRTKWSIHIFKNGHTKVKCTVIIKTVDANENIQNNGIVGIHFYVDGNVLKIGR